MPTAKAGTVSLVYRVFSADDARLSEVREIDGEQLTVTRDVVSVQLVPEEAGTSGTLFLNVPQSKAVDHPFVVGKRVTVSFTEYSE